MTDSQINHLHGVEVRGRNTFNTPASRFLRFLATTSDIFFIFSIGLVTLKSTNTYPLPSWTVFLLLTVTGFIYWFPQKKLLGITLGEKIWHLKAKDSFTSLYQKDYVSLVERIKSGTITALTCVFTLIGIHHIVLSHPLWLAASTENWDDFVPPSSDHWVITPFFYHIGGWPTDFDNQPIFYTLIYENGPPKRFLGHITLHFNEPGIQISLEGPKTPLLAETRQKIKDCLSSHSLSYSCIQARYQSLLRHIDEMQALNPSSWNISWFQVHNPILPETEQPQGIHLSAKGITNPLHPENPSIQDRYILINPQGIHQTVILTRTSNAKGDQALQLTQQSIRSLRSLKELDAAKSWINRELENIQLTEIQNLSNLDSLVTRLTRIQALLISKLSVEPGSFESYFHLAGTSLLLSKDSRLKNDEISIKRTREKIAIQNIKSVKQFARDVSPQDARNTQIESMLSELKNY